MIRGYPVEAVRRAEAVAMARLPEGDLMQRAAAGLAVTIADLLPAGVYGARVVLLVGAGNNGGDALYAGARLARRGAAVVAVQTGSTAHEGGRASVLRAGGRWLRVGEAGDEAELASEVGRADVVVDGLLGIGGRPGLRASDRALLDLVPSRAVVVAVDLPSGVDPDTGETPAAHVWADATVTFGLEKPCLLLPPADRAAGRVVPIDIGLDEPADADHEGVIERWTRADAARAWPVPGPADDKYRRGVVGVIAGGSTYTGAAVLCTGAAVRAGAGMVRYVGPQPPTDIVRSRWPEVVPGDGRCQAWVVGPGVDAEHDEAQRAAAERALIGDDPCVVDAGALLLLPDRRTAPTLLTPHAGELARLLSARTGRAVERGEVEQRPWAHAREAARLTGATVLLKGATTVIVEPGGRTRAQPDGPHWLATAGSGDVLAGLCGALLAAELSPLDAATLAVIVHGRAADQANAGGPLHAEAVLHAVPLAVRDLLAR